ncbi:MAG: hypothetical protein GX033_04075 [Firmicutes bacterium]|nr:hypothetical protein [Bacillota bacterium]
MSISTRRMLKIGAALLAFTLIAGLLWFANGLVGNPLSHLLANRAAKRYVAATYPHLDLELEKARYDFKSGGYYVHVKSPTSVDTHFTLRLSPWGELSYDDYEHRVADRFNTLERITGEYRKAVETILDGDDFPYRSYISYGEIAPYYEHKEFGPQYGVVQEELVLDKAYDVMELGKTAGHIVLYIEDEPVTVERAAEILLDIRRIMDKEKISFYAIDFVLNRPREDGKPDVNGPRVNVQDFLYEDIYEEGLVERVAEADRTLNEYYAEQDAKHR